MSDKKTGCDKGGRWFVVALICFLASCFSINSNAKEFGFLDASITDLSKALERGDITSAQLVTQYLARIEAYDQQGPALNTIIRLNAQAFSQAVELDKERKQRGSRGLLHGIPIIVKDNFNTKNIPTSAGSVALAGFIPSADAFQVAKLREAGAIILAKANMDELARGTSGYSALGGQTKNPYDLTRNPGGSVAGTSAAIAANFAAIGMGTDTCGSIRVPASFNNLVGLRPTKGLSSINGIIPLLYFDDVAGPLARSVRDLAIIMDNTVGYDAEDSATDLVKNYSFSGFVNGLGSVDLSALRLGRLDNLFDENEISKVNKVIDGALNSIKKQGVTIVDIDAELFTEIQKTLEPSLDVGFEYRAGMEQYFLSNPNSGFKTPADFIDHGLYHAFLDSNIPLSEFSVAEITEPQWLIKKTGRVLLSNAIEQVMAKHNLDALIYPTVKTLPGKLGEREGLHLVNNCGLSASSGAPALALPVGFTDTGLPVGIDILGAKLSDERLVAIAYALEKILGERRAPLTTPVLVNGLAPTPVLLKVEIDNVVKVELKFDVTKSALEYQTRFLDDQEIYAVCLHKSKQGPVIECLSGPQGRRLNGTVMLNNQHINALQSEELYLRIFSSDSPLGQQHRQIVFPLFKQND